ncbi:hypothetical protein AB0M68_43450, partial [Streptomyces sp. NPDC051453]|uniref:hypothetical protein n=1 Tax=Streptomyces sp. NPDC051453 TaxID=3154941 RepID=UPI00342F0708
SPARARGEHPLRHLPGSGCRRAATSSAADAQIAWTGNAATVERQSLRLPSAAATAAIRLVVKAANRTWGDLCVNEITTR